MKHPYRAMTIAGSSAGGSAGIQADLKTFQELDVYGMSIITAIVGRHPKTDKNVHAISLEAIGSSIFNSDQASWRGRNQDWHAVLQRSH